jgi:cholesterol 7-dehydrogenase
MVWNNKRYRGKPVLAKEDHLIARHRRWYSQFYSENSPRLENAETFEW